MNINDQDLEFLQVLGYSNELSKFVVYNLGGMNDKSVVYYIEKRLSDLVVIRISYYDNNIYRWVLLKGENVWYDVNNSIRIGLDNGSIYKVEVYKGRVGERWQDIRESFKIERWW